MTKTIPVILICLLFGCSPDKPESPTKGRLSLLIPESVAPVLIQEVNAFLTIYGNNGAEVEYRVFSSEEIVREFLLDTLRLVFSTRRLTTAEKELAKQRTGALIEIPVAYDGIVAVVHHKNSFERISTPELSKMLTGPFQRWEQLVGRSSVKGRIAVILQDSSDVSRYLERRLLGGKTLLQQIHRTRSSLETLREVNRNELAIGFVGLDWVDSARVPVKVLEVAEPEETADTTFRPPVEAVGKYYPPHPANIFRNYYPLKRTLYLYTTSERGDIASGFGSFVSNKEGQRIFLNRGFVPGTQPIRLKPGR